MNYNRKESVVVCVYQKGNTILALGLQEALIQGDKLILNGWVHLKTMDACAYIEHLMSQQKL